MLNIVFFANLCEETSEALASLVALPMSGLTYQLSLNKTITCRASCQYCATPFWICLSSKVRKRTKKASTKCYWD